MSNDEDEEQSSTDDNFLGANKVNSRKQARIPDEVLDELGLEEDDLLGFAKTEDNDGIRLFKPEIGGIPGQ